VGSIGLAPASRLDVMPAQASFATGWTTYHFDNARSGNDTGEPAMTTQNGAAIVSGGLDEKLQAAPLVYSGLVFAATENDTVYALRVADGVQTRAPIDLDYADIDPRAEGQRSALILANGYTYIAFGGRDGDCPPYHPVVVAVSTTTGTAVHWDPQTGGQSEAG